jgi:hypothetical protein
MSAELRCWKCDGDLPAVVLPLRRSEFCPLCTCDLHVCHMCRFFDPDAQRGCREPVAEEVRDRTRANFCGWFQADKGTNAASGAGESAAAKGDLESLFGMELGSSGDGPTDAASARTAFDALFDDGSKK